MSDNSTDHIFAFILVAILFLPIFYLIWMFSSVRNFFLSWAVLIVGLVGLSFLAT